jgi:hypothetical protein
MKKIGDIVVHTESDEKWVLLDVPRGGGKCKAIPLGADPVYVNYLADPELLYKSHLQDVNPIRFTEEEKDRAVVLVAEYQAWMNQREGLFDKYTILRTEDGEESPTAFFVLDRRDPAALFAAVNYSAFTSDKQLAADIDDYVLYVAGNYYGELRWDKFNNRKEGFDTMIDACRQRVSRRKKS